MNSSAHRHTASVGAFGPGQLPVPPPDVGVTGRETTIEQLAPAVKHVLDKHTEQLHDLRVDLNQGTARMNRRFDEMGQRLDTMEASINQQFTIMQEGNDQQFKAIHKLLKEQHEMLQSLTKVSNPPAISVQPPPESSALEHETEQDLNIWATAGRTFYTTIENAVGRMRPRRFSRSTPNLRLDQATPNTTSG